MDRVSINHDHLDLASYGIFVYKLPYAQSGTRNSVVKESIVGNSYRFPEKVKNLDLGHQMILNHLQFQTIIEMMIIVKALI